MTNTWIVNVMGEDSIQDDDFHALFADLEELEPFDIKKEEIAAQLAALLSYAKISRSEFARKSGWKRSRVTNILNGCGNPTYKTLWEFARCLGYEADLNFRLPAEFTALQPWQKNIINTYYFSIQRQTSYQVIKDLVSGLDRGIYYSAIPQDNDIKTISSQNPVGLKNALSATNLLPLSTSLNI